MNLKKVTANLLIGVMSAGLLTGCGSSSTKAEPTATQALAANEATPGANEETSEKSFDGTTITLSLDGDVTPDGLNAVVSLAKEKLGITVEVETRVSGADGDNLVKTRLASGDMTDICWYNSGSKFKALNPVEYFADLTDKDFADQLDETYKETVTVDGKLYGVPVASTQAGAVIYYKPDYKELNLSIPTTWDEFLSNCEKLKAAGKTAMIGTFGDAWTSQVVYLGDNYNVISKNPNFAEEFEAGKAKYETTPEGVESFQKLADLQQYYNEDYTAATYDDGCDMLANGEGTHWIMLTQTIGNIASLYPEAVYDIGVFGIPGDDTNDNGLTVWEPGSMYVNKNSSNIDACIAFLKFYISKEGLDAYAAAVKPDGPYCVKGYELPENSYPAVKDDMQKYFDQGKTIPALEFLSSVKGAYCEQICVEVGSGQISAQEAANAYDEDCKKMALQLGLNWK
jgi:raffinose/stachyose/melibiose transport system substrate-binding protein